MKILLVNPPNCGRSIPEERYGIDSIKQIFRGEPLALEVLAGNLQGHQVQIIDLKADQDGFEQTLLSFDPDLVGITGVTCEANTVLRLATEVRNRTTATIVVGGIHASIDPEFFNCPEIDHIVIGLGKASFQELLTALETGQSIAVPGVAATSPGEPLTFSPRKFSTSDLVNDKAPCYQLVAAYRSSYTISSLNLQMGFVNSAAGCPYSCSFCCISGLTGGRYLPHRIDSVIRDIRLLSEIPVIRFIDANTFGDVEHARHLCTAIREAGINKQFIADVRSDTVVNHPELMRQWREAGLKAVIIGFEEISDERLRQMNKANKAAYNQAAIPILHDLGIRIVGDFIISPDYESHDFKALGRYIKDHAIDLPMLTILTPLPGTRLHGAMQERILVHDLDYYTLTNAVIPTRMPEEDFYQRYADLLKEGHTGARL
jgi:hopanoid C-3 methylase